MTGLSSFWGFRTAKQLVESGDFELVVGVDSSPPPEPLDGLDFIRSDQSYSSLARLVKRTEVDTIVHTFLVLSSASISRRALHEKNVIGTMNLLGAAGQSGSKVKQIVVKSSSLIYGSSFRDPTFFTETSPRAFSPRTEIERSLIEAEAYIQEFAEDKPHVDLCVLRFPNVIGPTVEADLSQALIRGVAPVVLGFDPLLQFVDEEEVLSVIQFVTGNSLSGVYNVSGDGRIPWSSVYTEAMARPLPISPLMSEQFTRLYQALGIAKVPRELIDLLRFGRGIDNRKLKNAGYEYGQTTSEAVRSFAEYAASLRSGPPSIEEPKAII